MNREKSAVNTETKLGEIRHLLSHLHDEVSVLEQSYTQILSVLKNLEGVAGLDDLTGLMRRNTFFKKWNTLLQDCESLNETCGVLMIDIDHFKKINDTYGHSTGDEVIRQISAILKEFQSPHCIAGRFGGEEFIVAVRDNNGGADTLSLAKAIREKAESLHGPAVGQNLEWNCTVSIGLTTTKNNKNTDQLVRTADEALYDAKHSGRNRVCAA